MDFLRPRSGMVVADSATACPRRLEVGDPHPALRSGADHVFQVDAPLAGELSHERCGADLVANSRDRGRRADDAEVLGLGGRRRRRRAVAGVDHHQHVAQVRHVALGEARLQHAACDRRRQLHGRFGRLHLAQRRERGDLLPRRHLPRQHLRLADALAQVGQLELERHRASVVHGRAHGGGDALDVGQVVVFEQLRRIHHVVARHAPRRTAQRIEAALDQPSDQFAARPSAARRLVRNYQPARLLDRLGQRVPVQRRQRPRIDDFDLECPRAASASAASSAAGTIAPQATSVTSSPRRRTLAPSRA